MVPEAQKAELYQTVADAQEWAAHGNVASGMALLVAGSLRAEADRDSGEPWAERLIEGYDRALDRYVVDHHLRARASPEPPSPARPGKKMPCPRFPRRRPQREGNRVRR